MVQGLCLILTRHDAWHLFNYLRSLEAGRQPSRGELFHVEPLLESFEIFLGATNGKGTHGPLPTHRPSQEGLG
jgi:hypothetical protein